MSNKGKSFFIIEISGKKTDWESWSKKFFLHGKQKGYKMLLVSSGSISVSTQHEYENLLESDMDFNKESKIT